MEQHDTLLIACGSLESRRQLRCVVQERFNLLEATNTRQMLLLLEQNMNCIAAVLLDISNKDAIDPTIQTDPQAVQLLKQIPVVVIADAESYHDLTHYFRYGAADVLPLNYDPFAMLHRIETIAQLTLHRKHLETIVEQQRENLRHFSDNMVDALSAIIEYRNMESGHHILRIRNFTRLLLEEVMHHCPEYALTPRQVAIISSASALHDVGKIGIPDAILTKPGKLTPEEWETMKTHSLLGCQMLGSLASTVDQEYLKYAYNICRHHHERWDGRGYPDQLEGENIPICAQIVGLTDCYDALTADRVYKKAYSHAQAVNMILGGECGVFSPKLLECFKNVVHRFDQLSREYANGRDPGQSITDMSLPAPSPQEQSVNLLEKTRAKFTNLVHYFNVFLMDVRLDTGTFHVVYNPYPELAQLQGASTLRELTDIVACQVVIPEEQERMYQVIREEMPKFIQEDLRRQSFYFHHRSYAGEPSGPFEMTFLRIGSDRNPQLSILCRKTGPQTALSFQDGSMMANFTECTYVCRNDSGFTLVRPGRDTHSLGGYTPQEVMDLFGGRLLDMAFPEERAKIRAEFDRQLKDGPIVRTEYRFICKDGSVGWVVNKSQLVLGDDGQEYIKTFLFDITESKVAYTALNETLYNYRTILSQTENVLFDLDVTTGQISFTDTWKDIFGYTPSKSEFSRQLSGETHVHPDDIPLLMDRLSLMSEGSDYEVVEIRIATIKGRYLWCRVRGTANRDDTGKLVRILGVIININSEIQAREALEDRANRDALTRLLNKNAGKSQIEAYLHQHSRNPQCALIMLDLDNFKEVNDCYGHLFGDAMLTQVSRILTTLFHSQDIIARVGGDEFMVLVRGVADRTLLASQCRRLRDMLIQAFQSESMNLQLGCSIGIALCPEHGSSYYELFSKADRALYQAKAGGKNNLCFYQDGSSLGYIASNHSSTPIDSDLASGFSGTDLAGQILHNLFQAEDVPTAVNQALALMGQQANVSRVYIFENSEDGTYCTNTFEWCNEGISPQMQNLQHVSYVTDIPGYQGWLNEGSVFYCHDVQDLPQAAYDVIAPQGIHSMLHYAFHFKGKFCGYIGFDECSSQRFWTKVELQILTRCSDILATFLMKYREMEKTRIPQEDYWTAIVDPQNHLIRHSEHSGEAGKTCYQALLGKDGPCEKCLSAGLEEGQRGWTLVKDDDGQILVEASPVQWQDKRCCRITCRRLPR